MIQEVFENEIETILNTRPDTIFNTRSDTMNMRIRYRCRYTRQLPFVLQLMFARFFSKRTKLSLSLSFFFKALHLRICIDESMKTSWRNLASALLNNTFPLASHSLQIPDIYNCTTRTGNHTKTLARDIYLQN